MIHRITANPVTAIPAETGSPIESVLALAGTSRRKDIGRQRHTIHKFAQSEMLWPAKGRRGYSETRSSQKDATFSTTVRWSDGWATRIVVDGYIPQPALTERFTQIDQHVVLHFKRTGYGLF